MEDGSETNGARSIDELCNEAIAQADRAVQADPLVEEGFNPNGDTTPEPSPNKAFCQEIIATFLNHHAKSVRHEFFSKLEPIAGQSTAQRIADRAAMSPTMQGTLSEAMAGVLEKWNLTRFAGPEAIVIVTGGAYWMELSSARREMNALLNPNPQPQSAQ